MLFVTYQLYSNPAKEFQFSAIAQGLFILPFFLFSALSGQLADDHDKARLIRIIKFAEIGIMIVGGAGLMLANIPLMLAAVFAMGVHSTFFGPIKYAILPQHLQPRRGARRHRPGRGRHLYRDPRRHDPRRRPRVDARDRAAAARIGFAVLGFLAGRQVPPAPPAAERLPITWHIVHASIELVSATMHIRAAVPRHPRDQLLLDDRRGADHHLPAAREERARRQRAGREPVHRHLLDRHRDRIGAINRLLKSEVSARFAPASVIAMGVFVLMLHFVALTWGKHGPDLTTLGNFLLHPMAGPMILALLGVAITGGMFVVPLYAFLTTTVPKSETARTVAANNIVNSGAMVIGSLIAFALQQPRVGPVGQLLLVAAMCLVSAWLGWKLHLACD